MAKTIKCRISLAVDPKGSWAAGGSDCDKGKFCDYILVEVEVTVPEVTTVAGSVKEAP